MSQLRVTYSPAAGVGSLQDEGYGSLTAEVASRGFSGQGSAWISVLAITDFIRSCQAFPLSAENPPVLEGGFYSDVHPGRLDQVLVGIRVSQFDIHGRLLVCTTLAIGGGKALDQELQHSVTTQFLTDYATLDVFCRDLGRLLQDGEGQALLHGA